IYKDMKYLFIFLFSILLNVIQTTLANEPVKISVQIDNSLTQTPQWVYWVSLIGNDHGFIDSLYLEKGMRSFELEHSFTEDQEYYATWLAFAKNGPSQSVLQVKPGDNLIVFIDEDTGLFPRGEGSFSIKESYANLQETSALVKKIEQMQDSLVLAESEIARKDLELVLDSLNNYLKVGIRLKFMENSQSSCVYMGYLSVVNDFLPDEEINELVAVMKKRFPDSKEVQMYPERKRYPKESEDSKAVRQRIEEIMAEKYGYAIKQTVRPTIDSIKLSGIKSYQMGDKVSRISLKGLNGQTVNLDNMKSDYVLIDFWASWCAPCRKEIPYLKTALDTYPNLTVYAVSIDEDEAQWRASIKKDKTEMFTHVLLGNNTTESAVIQKQFGVRAIPANFLLDKERRIVAVNLRQN
ncbi:MAG: TlpA disulfide reductase family protein, partial [Gallicola sp.]|nr:TlpA disulfide reductase family protein [Gallicola sp.]